MFNKKSSNIQNVWILSVVAFLNDIAGETIRRLFPLFLTTILGASTTIIGLIEGVGESVPHLLEPVSGFLSDKMRKRKIFVVLGQGLRMSMVMLVFVVSWPQALLVRFLDRTGKGLALAPRDALITDSTDKGEVGKAFGLNRAFDNLGATVGLVMVVVLMFFFGKPESLTIDFFRLLVIALALPSLLLALILLITAVVDIKKRETEYKFKDHFGREFYGYLAVTFLFFLGNFSDGFFILRAYELGLTLLEIFVLLALLTLSSTLVSVPAGDYSDHHSRRRVLAFGWLLCAAAFIGFAGAGSFWQLTILFTLYGVYYGVTQGVAKALVADLVPPRRVAFAFGIFNVVSGIAIFAASFLAGILWTILGSETVFYLGAVLAVVAAFLLLHILPHPTQSHLFNWGRK